MPNRLSTALLSILLIFTLTAQVDLTECHFSYHVMNIDQESTIYRICIFTKKEMPSTGDCKEYNDQLGDSVIVPEASKTIEYVGVGSVSILLLFTSDVTVQVDDHNEADCGDSVQNPFNHTLKASQSNALVETSPSATN